MVAASPYFHALLGPNYREANENDVVLTDIDGKTLTSVIEFCYTGRIKIDTDNVNAIMAAASSKELIHLEKICSQFWSEKLDISNCLSVLLVAEKYHLTDLRHTSVLYICANFVDIPIAEMVKVDEKMLEAILKQDQLSAPESFIFECFMKWVQHDELHRSVHVALLANLIRLEHIPGEVMGTFFVETIHFCFIFNLMIDFQMLNETVEPFYEKHGCLKLVLDEYRRYRKRSYNSGAISLCRIAPPVIKLFCTAWKKGAKEMEIYEFDENLELWAKLRTVTFEIGPISYCVYANGKLFVFGAILDDFNRLQIKVKHIFEIIFMAIAR